MSDTYMGSYGTLDWAQAYKNKVDALEQKGDWVTHVDSVPTDAASLVKLLASVPENGLVVEG